MESDVSSEQKLEIAQRAAAAPWIDTTPPSKWWAPAGGVLHGALVATLGERDHLHPGPYVLLLLLLVALVWAWVGWGYSRNRAVPRLRGAPAEFVPLIRAYFAGYALLAALVVILFVTAGSRVAAVVAAVSVYAGIQVYERRYRAAADAVRARLT